jgi:ribonuclease HII
MKRQAPDLSHELALYAQGYYHVAGLDEAGRGAWAGPLVAAAVVLPMQRADLMRTLVGVRDSKELTPRQRQRLYGTIMETAVAVGVGLVSSGELDALGVVEATRRAMDWSLAQLSAAPDYLLVDALSLPAQSTPQRSIIHGDALCLSIAAASIVAKVSRDRLMAALDDEYPGYGFASHKGYGTPAHRAALARLGPTPVHRFSYAPLRALAERIR